MDLKYNKLNKKAKNCMRLSSIIGFIILACILGIAIGISGTMDINIPYWVDIILIALLLFNIINIIFAPMIRYKRYKYYIDEEKIIVIEGLWFITKEIVPIERIHQISIERGPIDRIYGLSKVVATTAGDTISIRFLENEIAENIAENLQIRIGTIVKAQRSENNA